MLGEPTESATTLAGNVALKVNKIAHILFNKEVKGLHFVAKITSLVQHFFVQIGGLDLETHNLKNL